MIESIDEALLRMLRESRQTRRPVTETFKGISITMNYQRGDTVDLAREAYFRARKRLTPDQRQTIERQEDLSYTHSSLDHLDFGDPHAVWEWLVKYVPLLTHPDGVKLRASVLQIMLEKLKISQLPQTAGPAPQKGVAAKEWYTWHITNKLIDLRKSIGS